MGNKGNSKRTHEKKVKQTKIKQNVNLGLLLPSPKAHPRAINRNYTKVDGEGITETESLEEKQGEESMGGNEEGRGKDQGAGTRGRSQGG